MVARRQRHLLGRGGAGSGAGPGARVAWRQAAADVLGAVRDRAEQARTALVERGADASSRGSYARWWAPKSVSVATAQIYDTTDLATFEEGGRRDAGWVLDHLGETSTVLDLGCGIGRVARYVAPACRQLWAVDVSPRMLALARERLDGLGNVVFALCHDVVVPDVPTAAVDLAYSLLVLQHVEREDAYLLLEELHRMVRPGGTALLTFPNLLSDVYLKGFVDYARRRASFQRNRARCYTPQEVERLLVAAGYEVVDLDGGAEIRVVARRA